MTNFLLIRHGNSIAAEFAPGRMNSIHLSDEGIKQAEKLAEKIAAYKIDMILSSPLDRTKETAEIIAAKFGKKVEFLENLLELDLGEWTGKSFKELEQTEKWHQYHSLRSVTRIPSGELFIEVQFRMISQIQKLAESYKDKTVIIVSHGDPIRSIITYFSGIPIDLSTRIHIDTASVSMISISRRNAIIRFVNKWGFHLPPQGI
ncbi:MAG: histidine phosphatase family protein [Bacillota bacterium]